MLVISTKYVSAKVISQGMSHPCIDRKFRGANSFSNSIYEYYAFLLFQIKTRCVLGLLKNRGPVYYDHFPHSLENYLPSGHSVMALFWIKSSVAVAITLHRFSKIFMSCLSKCCQYFLVSLKNIPLHKWTHAVYIRTVVNVNAVNVNAFSIALQCGVI